MYIEPFEDHGDKEDFFPQVKPFITRSTRGKFLLIFSSLMRKGSWEVDKQWFVRVLSILYLSIDIN